MTGLDWARIAWAIPIAATLTYVGIAATRSFRRARRVIAETRTPVPGPPAIPPSGTASLPEEGAAYPGRHAPAPGQPHGGINSSVLFTAWNCGRLIVRDTATGRILGQRPCACAAHIDWDAELRRELGKWKP